MDGPPRALNLCYGSSISDGSIFTTNLLLQWQWYRNKYKNIILVIFSNLPHFGPLWEPREGPSGATIPYFSVFISNIFQSWPIPRFLITLFRKHKENHEKFKNFPFFDGTLIPLRILGSWIGQNWSAAPFFVQNVPILGFSSLGNYAILQKSAPWDGGYDNFPSISSTVIACQLLYNNL